MVIDATDRERARPERTPSAATKAETRPPWVPADARGAAVDLVNLDTVAGVEDEPTRLARCGQVGERGT